MSDLEKKIEAAINSVSAENVSNTPDYILAQYLIACLAAFNEATQKRETWYGRDGRQSFATSTALPIYRAMLSAAEAEERKS